jgi:thermostable 8-oxoguanine DNA glycosylase
MKVLILFFFLLASSFEIFAQQLEVRDFNYKPEKIVKGSSVLLSFCIYNAGKNLPADAFKMECTINGILVSLDDDTKPLLKNEKQRYSKQPGKFHWEVQNEKELVVEIILTPKVGYLEKTIFKRTIPVE